MYQCHHKLSGKILMHHSLVKPQKEAIKVCISTHGTVVCGGTQLLKKTETHNL